MIVRTTVVDKCLAFCQALINSHQKFPLNLSVGKDTFVFNNKELEQSSCKKKKKSPSQIRRETRRREARLKEHSCKDTEEESENEKLKPDNHVHKCNFCEINFNSEKGLEIHVGKSHKSNDSTPEKERTASKPASPDNLNLSAKEARDETAICPPPEDEVACNWCGELWGPATTRSQNGIHEEDMTIDGLAGWWRLCSSSWSDNFETPDTKRFI